MGRQNASDSRIHGTTAQAATTTFTAEACHQSEIFLSIRKASAGRSIRSHSVQYDASPMMLVKAFVQYSTVHYNTVLYEPASKVQFLCTVQYRTESGTSIRLIKFPARGTPWKRASKNETKIPSKIQRKLLGQKLGFSSGTSSPATTTE